MRIILTVFSISVVLLVREIQCLQIRQAKTLQCDGFSNTMQLAQKYGYRCEEHFVKTSDGYILTMHRLNGKINGPKLTKNAPTVLLMHGIFGASTSFIFDGENSPGGILTDHGFDVWMGNCRGNRYSKKHEKFKSTDKRFWNFTYNEIALEDHVTFLKYVLKKVEKKSLHYVGFSQGGVVIGSLLAYRPEYNKMIKSLTFVAAALALDPINSVLVNTILNYVAPVSKNRMLQIRPVELVPHSKPIVNLVFRYCNKKSMIWQMCRMAMNDIVGFDSDWIDQSRYPCYITQSINGASSNQLLHFSQAFVERKLSLFDYGREQNMLRYNQETTPELNFSIIKPPKLFIYGGTDNVITEGSVNVTLKMVKNVKKVVRVEGYSHFNFLHSYDIKEKVYDIVAKYIKEND